jgi:hypothetical protein
METFLAEVRNTIRLTDPPSCCRSLSSAPPGLVQFLLTTLGLRRGLHSDAASRLYPRLRSRLGCVYDVEGFFSQRSLLAPDAALHRVNEIGTKIRGGNNVIEGTHAQRPEDAVYLVKFAGHLA